MLRTLISSRLKPRERWKHLLLVFMLCLGLVASLFVIGCGTSSIYKDEGSVVKSTSTSQNQSAKESDSVGTSKSESAAPTSSQVDLSSGSEVERKAIIDGTISIKVQDSQQISQDIAKLAGDYGGYVVSSYLSKSGDYFNGQVIIKVPQDKLQEVSDKIIAMGELMDKRQTSKDVTEEYYDSEARLKVLKEKEARLTSFMAQATTISDLISIEREIAENRSQIEVLQGRMNYLNNATTYSQLTVSLTQAVPGQVEAPVDAWGRATQGLVTSMNTMVKFLSWMLMALFVLAPWLVLLFLLILLLRWFIKKRLAKRKAKRRAAGQGPELPDIKQ